MLDKEIVKAPLAAVARGKEYIFLFLCQQRKGEEEKKQDIHSSHR